MEKAFMFPNLLGLEIAHNISNYIILKMASSYCKEIGKYNFHMTILQNSHIFCCCCQTAYWSKSDLCFEGHQDTTVYFQIEERLGKHSTENSRMEVKHFNNYLPISVSLFCFSFIGTFCSDRTISGGDSVLTESKSHITPKKELLMLISIPNYKNLVEEL